MESSTFMRDYASLLIKTLKLYQQISTNKSTLINENTETPTLRWFMKDVDHCYEE